MKDVSNGLDGNRLGKKRIHVPGHLSSIAGFASCDLLDSSMLISGGKFFRTSCWMVFLVWEHFLCQGGNLRLVYTSLGRDPPGGSSSLEQEKGIIKLSGSDVLHELMRAMGIEKVSLCIPN